LVIRELEISIMGVSLLKIVMPRVFGEMKRIFGSVVWDDVSN